MIFGGEFPNRFLLEAVCLSSKKGSIDFHLKNWLQNRGVKASANACSSITEGNTVVRLIVMFECWTRICFFVFSLQTVLALAHNTWQSDIKRVHLF